MEPEHWSDCATNNAPAMPAGPCDCMPTPAMCRAAVEYMNGADVYEKVPREVLDIEEGIYREVWLAMQDKAPSNVEVTGAARLHRAASRERSERGRPQG